MTNKQNLTIDDIARDLGVSKTTVSRAISGKGRISPATRQRVQEYIEQCNYRPSAAAKGLAESKTYNLALVLPRSFINLDQPYTRMSMSAICEEAFVHDYNILVCLSTDDTMVPLLRTLDNRKVDGVILSRTVENDALVDILYKRGIPFATIGSLTADCRGKAAVEADHDQVGGCRAFAAEFLHVCPGTVAVMGNDMNYIVNQSRIAGIRQAMKALNLPEEKVAFYLDLKNNDLIYKALDDLLAKGIRSILFMDDGVCINALPHLKSLGLRIPDDIRIASLYDSDLMANYNPPISALQFDAAALGRVTCRELLHCLQGEDFDSQPILGYRIIHRNSI